MQDLSSDSAEEDLMSTSGDHQEVSNEGIPEHLIKFSLMAFLGNFFGLALLTLTHLVIKLCLASLFEQISKLVGQ